MLVVDNITRCIIKYMDRKRTIISVAGVACVLFLVVLYTVFLWPSDIGEDVDSRLPETSVAEIEGNNIVLNSASNIKKDDSELKMDVFEPITRPFREILEYFIEKPSPETPDNSNEEKTLAEREKEAQALSQRMTQNHLYTPRPLTEEEIFDRLWPPSYRDYLLELEEFLIREGSLTKEKKHAVFDSEEDGYVILLALADYAEMKGFLPKSDIDLFRIGVTKDLPYQLEIEKKALQQGKSATLVPGYQRLAGTASGMHFFVKDILEGLQYMMTLWAPDAYAGWNVSPDCYKDFNPEYVVPGFNNKTICCDCGLIWVCSPYCVCVYQEHCGPAGCDCENWGCLNGQCGTWPNAIWDPETTTCGCG